MQKRKKSLILAIINYVLYSLVIVLGFLILASKLPWSGGLKVFTVASGSMAPAYAYFKNKKKVKNTFSTKLFFSP